MAQEPLRKEQDRKRPEIWSEGSQRPPFRPRALARASLHLAREGVAPIHAWIARRLRILAEKVRDGAGRIPADRLGRAARFVPSHLRVAVWIKTIAAIMSHASASADPDVARGNGLVAVIEPHLWDTGHSAQSTGSEPGPAPAEPPPVILPEPAPVGSDPLEAIRSDIGDKGVAAGRGHGGGQESRPVIESPPAPPGQVAITVIQIAGYLVGWATVIIALPYGLARALWLFASGQDLRKIGTED